MRPPKIDPNMILDTLLYILAVAVIFWVVVAYFAEMGLTAPV